MSRTNIINGILNLGANLLTTRPPSSGITGSTFVNAKDMRLCSRQISKSIA